MIRKPAQRPKILAIIPARGASRGVPNKNIKRFSGKPLIAWTIETVLASRVADRVLVSTDDAKIHMIVSVADRKQMERVIGRIKKLPGVRDVERILS